MKCDKKDLLLYAVTDRHWLDGRKLIDVVRESLDGGVTMLQLREKALAEEKGLVCSKAGQYGWNTQGKGNDRLTEYALEKGWSEIKISRGGYQRFNVPAGGTQSSTGQQTGGERRPSSTRKYQCPCCKNSVRATKAVNILCGDCMVKMEVVD